VFNLSCVKGDLVLGLLLLSVGSPRALEVHLNGFLRLRLLAELEGRFLDEKQIISYSAILKYESVTGNKYV
jgi:hypothetical protein